MCLNKFIRYHVLQKLENLVLKNCVWVTNGAMEVLAFHSYMKIKYVDFTGCCGISEASIILFIARQPKWDKSKT